MFVILVRFLKYGWRKFLFLFDEWDQFYSAGIYMKIYLFCNGNISQNKRFPRNNAFIVVCIFIILKSAAYGYAPFYT